MIDRPQGGERAILVHVNFPAGSMQEDLTEFKELVLSAGAFIFNVVTATRQVPDPKYFVGTGKAEEIRHAVVTYKAELVIFNHSLSPAQERNLEHIFKARVLDRTGLILDIFAQRARSFEGKLQVELALLKHLSTRLVRGWTHLERQRGGIGLRGPGETQLETDRRLIRSRIKFISKRLANVRKQRAESRRARRKAIIPTVALIGYTNAGKSTLFNQLTGADVYAANRLFATLDPTLRRIEMPEVGSVILADTVGFIRHLPHDLVEAFYATLEEICEADLLLHVIDASDAIKHQTIKAVNGVLEDIKADQVPQLLVYNKIDLNEEIKTGVDRNAKQLPTRVWLSAKTKLGFPELQHAMIELLGQDVIQRSLNLSYKDASLRAQFYQLGAVLSEKILDDGTYELVIRMPKKKFEKIWKS